MSNVRPKCCLWWTGSTGFLLKKIGGNTTFLTLPLKITSCAYLERPFLGFV